MNSSDNIAILDEEEVYNGAKNWLLRNGFKVVAGQPARGVDHLPVIEIKGGEGDKGSLDAYKPDLVAIFDGTVYIIECKPVFNLWDYRKILSVLEDENRLKNFYKELDQYKILEKYNIKPGAPHKTSGIIAYSGPKEANNKDVLHLVVKSWRGEADIYS